MPAILDAIKAQSVKFNIVKQPKKVSLTQFFSLNPISLVF